ncbi:MAG: hypothetical protein HC784_13990, partial [Hydrococcus sp. CSU_1_8]|nr:hypothetical protein [Hydrococcus sp. CSU_1_8]
CLWTHLSIPLKETPREQAYQILEQVWVSWYQWWHPRLSQPLNTNCHS